MHEIIITMGFLINIIEFFLSVVLSGMAYFEYNATKDRMFLYLSVGAAFLTLTNLLEVLDSVYSFGEPLATVMSLIGYVVIIYGIYAQSKLYKIIR